MTEEGFQENRLLLQTFALHLVKPTCPVSEHVSRAILKSLLPLGWALLKSVTGETGGFPELMVVMHTLAGAGNGDGHSCLFHAANGWLHDWYVLQA